MDFSYNPISEISANTFRGLTEMESIDLSHNNISSLPKYVFTSCPKLRTLDLKGNKIHSIPDDLLVNNWKLSKLDLSANRLTGVVLSILNKFFLKLLHDLSLSNNNITHLPPGAFQNMTSLRALSLRNVSLASIDKNAFKWLPSLQVLDLSHNKLNTLEREMFLPLTSLREVRLNGNIFECTPQFQDAVMYLRSKSIALGMAHVRVSEHAVKYVNLDNDLNLICPHASPSGATSIGFSPVALGVMCLLIVTLSCFL